MPLRAQANIGTADHEGLVLQIVDRAGAEVAELTLSSSADLRELKDAFSRVSSIAPRQMRFQSAALGNVNAGPGLAAGDSALTLSDVETLSDQGLVSGDRVQFKDLGPQVRSSSLCRSLPLTPPLLTRIWGDSCNLLRYRSGTGTSSSGST